MANKKRFFSEEEIMVELYDRVVHGSPAGTQFAKAFSEFLKEIPTVDAVEVVRCRECKYHNKPPCPMRLSFNWTEDDDFCSYGERKEGADNE